MFSLRLQHSRAFRVGIRLVLAMAFALAVGRCSNVVPGEDGPRTLPPDIVENYCIKEAALISNLLAETGALTSCISESSCDRAIDTEEEGYFETWHLYADETSTVVLDADSEFDNLMQLALITEVTEQAVEAKVLVANDDRSAEDSRAQIAATLEATQDYLLRLSSFGDKETGCYTIRTIRVAPDEPLPAPPDTGSVGVMVSSTGVAPAAYTVTLNGAKAKSVAANGTVMYEGIVTGDYAVELSNLGDCTVDGDNPQNAAVNAIQTTTATFEISCPVLQCESNDDCVDQDECTVDATCNLQSLKCEGGSSQPVDTPCGTGDVCDGEGNCVECNDPQRCDDGNECTDDICDGNSCAAAIVAGPRCDYMGGSQNGVCNEQGECEAPPPACDPNPCADTGNDCTEEICNESDGSCSEINITEGTSCDDAPGRNVCDANGVCVGCNDYNDCPPSTNECRVPTCVSNVCESSPEPDWTSCNGGNCLGGTCQAIFPCTEQGIRNAIAEGGGARYTFDCNGPTVIMTQAEIVIDNDVVLDGEGELTLDGGGESPPPGIQEHRMLSVAPGVTAELAGVTARGGFLPEDGSQGAGIFNEGTLTLTNSSVNGGAYWSDSGGIHNLGTLTLVDSLAWGDISGGLASGIYSDGSLTMIRSHVSGFCYEFCDAVRSGGTLTLIDSAVSGGSGSGDCISSSGALTLINSTVSESNANAAIRSHGSATLVNSTVDGGGWDQLADPEHAIVHSGGRLTVISSTVTSPWGTGEGVVELASDADMYVANSLLVYSDESPIGPTCVGTVISGGGNIESPGHSCSFDQPTDLDDVSAAELNLGPLADYGGPTMTRALLPGSVAIDHVAMMCVDENGDPLTADQRGQRRPQGGACDSGAFEWADCAHTACEDANVCTSYACNTNTGLCQITAVPDGAPCSPAPQCDPGDGRCSAGVCESISGCGL